MATDPEPAQTTSTSETSTLFEPDRITHIISEWIFPLWLLIAIFLVCIPILDFLTGSGTGVFSRFVAGVVGIYVAFAGISDENMEGQSKNTHRLRSLPLLRTDGERRQVGGLVYSVGTVLLIMLLLGGSGGSTGGAPSATPATDTPTTTVVGTYDDGYNEDGEEEDDDDVRVRPGSGGSDDSSDGDDYGGDYGDGDDGGPDVDVGGDGVNIDWI